MTQNENQKPESKVFMFDEMIDAMAKSIANVEKVSNDQRLLIDTLNNSEQAEHFKNFIAENEKQLASLNAQCKELEARKTKLEQVMFIAKCNTDVEHALELLIDALGLFKK